MRVTSVTSVAAMAAMAAAAVVLVLGGCTGKAEPQTAPSAGTASAVAEEVVPLGYYRRPKDGEVCKKLDLTALKALVPGVAAGPSTGMVSGNLKCDYIAGTPSLVNPSLAVEFFASAQAMEKERDRRSQFTPNLRKVALPKSKAEGVTADGIGMGIYEQNIAISVGTYAVDKAVVTERFAEVHRQLLDDLLVLMRQEFQSTTGPSPTAAAPQAPKVVSPSVINGRQFTYDEPLFDDIRLLLQQDLDQLDASPAVASTYGKSKANNLIIFAATLAPIKAEAQIDATLSRLATQGITMSKPATDKPDEATEIRCGEAKLKEHTGALCLWRDKDSIGVAAFPGQKPAAVKADFLTLRKLATAG